MAIQFTDFSKAPILDSPAKNIFENVLKGYRISQEPAKIREQQSARELANNLRKMEVEHKPKEYKLNDQHKNLANAMLEKANSHYEEKFGLEKQLKQAQINKANQPEALKGALAQALQVRKQIESNPNSPTYERDLKDANSYINKLGTPRNGVQVTSSPDGGFEVSVGGQGQVANALGLPQLPKGQVYLFDENRKPIGYGKSYTDKEKAEEKGRAAFNIWQPFITDSQSYYSGQDSNTRFLDDVRDYSRDPKAKKRIDNLIAADDLLFSTTVKEEATLGGANTNQAYKQIAHSLKNSEIYPLLRKISEYNLPAGYKKASSDIYNDILNEGTAAGANIPAYKAYYFNENQRQANRDTNNINSTPAAKVPKIPSTVNTKEQFIEWLGTLTPSQRDAVKAQHVGGQ